MKHVPFTQRSTGFSDKNCTVYEYGIGDKDINIALIHLKGRYPLNGWSLNKKSKILAFIIKGTGAITFKQKSIKLSKGDTIFIDSGEQYFWKGNMEILLPASPAWNTTQYLSD